MVLNFSIFYLLFLLHIRAIYSFDLLNFYIIEDPPKNYFSVIGGLLVNIFNYFYNYYYYERKEI